VKAMLVNWEPLLLGRFNRCALRSVRTDANFDCEVAAISDLDRDIDRRNFGAAARLMRSAIEDLRNACDLASINELNLIAGSNHGESDCLYSIARSDPAAASIDVRYDAGRPKSRSSFFVGCVIPANKSHPWRRCAAVSIDPGMDADGVLRPPLILYKLAESAGQSKPLEIHFHARLPPGYQRQNEARAP
jgi:hypothetical protein